MAIIADIQRDITEALRRHDALTVETLRMVSASFHNREIEKRGKGDAAPLSEEEAQDTLRREVKKRREAVELFTKGGRADLADKEKGELAIIERYLPAGPSEADVAAAIERVLAANPGATKKEFGKIMGAVMKELGAGADGSLVGGLLGKKLS